EVKEGRGTPHGGVYLDIAWIKEKLPGAAEHIKKKLPSMYHQFKELGGLDITREPMEVGPTTHYIMGGVRVDADTQMSTVIPGLFAIVRVEQELVQALDHLRGLWDRARRVAAAGGREYNPGWHTCLDLHNLLTVSEAIALSAIERKESRGAQFRPDYPTKSEAFGKVNVMVKKGEDGRMQVSQVPIPPMPEYLREVIRR